MDDLYRLARQRIVFLLQAGHPEPGARLKQRLQREFEKEGLRFDERRWHFAKFSDFVAANNDIVAIERPAGPGDIVLRLKPDATTVVTGASQEQVEPGSRESGAPVIPSEIWQAFANPDPRRKRFLSRSSSQVVHFVDGENSRQQHEVEMMRSNFIEIEPIPAQEHTAWMREFLVRAALPDRLKSAIDPIVGTPYSGFVNQVFTSGLGQQYGDAWRHFRTTKVFEYIEQWATKQGLDLVALKVYRPARQADLVRRKSDDGGRRHALHALIDLLTDSELDLILIPAAVAARASLDRQGQ